MPSEAGRALVKPWPYWLSLAFPQLPPSVFHSLRGAGSPSPPHTCSGVALTSSLANCSPVCVTGAGKFITHRKMSLRWRPASTEPGKCLIFCRNVPVTPKLPSPGGCWSERAITALCRCGFCFCPSLLYNNLLNIRAFLKDAPLVTTCSCFFLFVFGTAGRELWGTWGLETHQYLFLSSKFSNLDSPESRQQYSAPGSSHLPPMCPYPLFFTIFFLSTLPSFHIQICSVCWGK